MRAWLYLSVRECVRACAPVVAGKESVGELAHLFFKKRDYNPKKLELPKMVGFNISNIGPFNLFDQTSCVVEEVRTALRWASKSKREGAGRGGLVRGAAGR